MADPTILYLDTSIIGGYFDEEFKEATQLLWTQMRRGRFRFLTSLVAADEIEEAPPRVRELWFDTFSSETILNVTAETEDLAEAYISRSVVTPKYSDDARHVAACTLARIEYLASWNFKHLVNVEREKGFNAINSLRGHSAIRIVSPLELVYGLSDENL